MSSRLALLPIGLFVLWCVVCQQWYVCHIKQVCGDKVIVEPHPTPTADTRPIVFSWSAPDPEIRPTWQAYRDSILAKLIDGKLLEIVGLYFKDETVPNGYANMGLARAAKVKERLMEEMPSINPEKIVVTSKLVNEPPDARTSKFLAADFNIKDKPKEDTVEIIEVDNTITILFPYAKSVKEPNPQVDEYLDKLAQRLKQTDETVAITGHTDDSGTVPFNQELGMARAKHVQDILISKGIKKDRLTIDSKGELEPVADNNTEEGSRLNRRVVLVLNKKDLS
ncbi:MAG: OmpA family protein [Bacteroidetes bacterium]|nr:OmpA family protein [Bacteroidota bacterium]